MGGEPAFGAARDCGRFWVSLFVLVAGITLVVREPAQAQETPACTPAIARVVSLQGDVQVQRGGAGSWSSVQRLDTTVCAGDRLRVAALSRAALFVQPETLIRLDQNTTITLRQTAEETHVELHAEESSADAEEYKCCGAVYLITRFPKKFKVTTPHMNAAVEGTEFMVQSSQDRSKLTVIEGTVSSESATTKDRQLVNAGQSIATGATEASAVTAVVKPEDAVQWVLRYPPISDQSDTTGISSAEKLLRGGSVDEALAVINAALAANSLNSDAQALRSIVQLAKNDKASALESARRATAIDSNNYRAWLALSYAQQAAFALDEALESARKAEFSRSDSALAHARVAELLISLGETRQAEDSARAAIATGSAESYAHSILGFVHLAQLNIEAARSEFATAIELDSFSALPRLGLGLSMIRTGKMTQGREQLEIAVALDPSNSLIRSYVGKSYYEERTRPRNDLAASQLELARKLDPNDPTPALYDAIRLQTINRPIEAVNKVQESISLNDNRAVYRSKELLVEDGAVRSISLARAYHEIGFDKQALRESAISINANPANSSAHRFLADSYLSLPRHEVARRSELLQSQLAQPLNANPIQPQLTEDNFFVLKSAGPTGTGFNEYTPMFTRNGLSFQADVVGGSLDTWGDQFIFSGMHDRVAFALSQLAYSTDGVRRNDEFDKRLYGAFIQFEPSTDLGLQGEFRYSDSEFGDPLLAFDPELVIDDRHALKDARVRVGVRKNLAAGSQLLVSVAAIDQRELVRSFGELAVEQDTESYVAEGQHVLQRERFNLVTGLGVDTEEQDSVFFGSPASFRPYAANTYAYLNTSPWGVALTLHLGMSIDYLADRDDLTRSRTDVNPKLGITLEPWNGATLRAATFETLGRQFATSETIEPTQVAGFNQFYDDLHATKSRRTAVALDQSVTDSVIVGAEWSRRDLNVPLDQSGEHYEWDERNAEGHLYWTVNEQVAITVEYAEEEFRRPVELPGKELITQVETRTLPLGVAVHMQSMFFARATVSYVEQSGEFFILAAGPDPVDARESFWIADMSVGYRFPNRRGIVSIEGRNLFDETFRFQETDLFTRQFARERLILGRVSLSF